VIGIVFNPISGTGRARAVAERMLAGLDRLGMRAALIESARSGAEHWLRPRLAGAELLVVAGGDGAVRTAAPEAARAGVSLWHAPCGTENLVARAFGMRADAAMIAAAMRAGRTRTIDLASASGEPFAIMASVGFDAEVVHDLSSRRSGGISHLSYVGPVLRQLAAWRAPELAWSIDGEREQLGRGMIVVGNLPDYGVRLNPAAEAIPDDGLLDAVFIPAEGALSLLPWAVLMRAGLHLRCSGVRVRRGRELCLHADRPVRLQLDGDPAGAAAGDSEYLLTPSPGALRVLLPA
jgi:diacylglycerol kinase family enzyme